MTRRFNIVNTPIQGLKLVQRKPIGDNRGSLERLFCVQELNTLLSDKMIMQINYTQTAKRGTVRGMHFQYPPHAETKFVSCLRGEIFDAAIDLRYNSPTFLQYHAEIISASNHYTLVIPEGFAHGFQTLTDDCELLYFHTEVYQPTAESGLNAMDPRFTIRWPLDISKISDSDAAHPMLPDDFQGINP